MSVTERSMGLSLRALGRIAGSSVVDRLGMRTAGERVVYRAARDGFRVAGATARTFAAASRLGSPARLRTTSGRGLFDLTPTEEQQMLQEACREFAEAVLRPAAGAAERGDGVAEVLAQGAELGLTMLGVPDAVGGAVEERSAVTTVLVAEALAHGDMGLATAMLAPAGVATALSLWGDADQQARMLPALVGDDVPHGAIALLERRPLFDPFSPATTARRAPGGGFVVNGAKALVPRAAASELLIVGARLEGHGPVLLVVEASEATILAKDEPAMGLRSAGPGEIRLDDVKLPESALLCQGSPEVYADCVRRARLAWCALAVGTARAVLDYVIPYVNERTAFGEPISHRQAVAFTVSDMAIDVEGMHLATLRAAARADAGQDCSREVALAHRLCTRHGARIGSDGVQLLGGHGFVTEHPIERWYRDLQAVGVMEGALLV
ncbi:MAG TPA: acyl-CoA dehydrogenase family protein [Baekduia sp.]|nr:acyl-CoA dehydrogenase family protein [Baekduia sp.]